MRVSLPFFDDPKCPCCPSTLRTPRREAGLLVAGLAFVSLTDAWTQIVEGRIGESLPAALVGVWEQTDGGVYMTTSNEAADFYHYTRMVCYKDEPMSGKPLKETYVRFRLEDGAERLTLDRYDLGERFDGFFAKDRFRRVAALPENTVTAPSRDKRFQNPEFVFELVWRQFDEHYGFFETRHVDWAERYRLFRPRILPETSEEALFGVLTGMLEGLGDSHARVYWDKRREPYKSGRARLLDHLDAAFAAQTRFTDRYAFRGDWVGRQKGLIEAEFAAAPFQRAAAGRMRFGRLQGNVGYLELDVLSGFGPSGTAREEQIEILEREMDRVVEALQGCRSVILDLSFNQGGADFFGAVVASRFADQRRHVLNEYATGEAPSAARQLWIEPSGPKQFTGPLYVLASQATVSAGETLALMLRAFPRVTQVGEPTRGCLSGLLNKSLPNPFHITLSNGFWTSPEGEIFEGKGIPPHAPFPVFDPENLDASYLEAVRKTMERASGKGVEGRSQE